MQLQYAWDVASDGLSHSVIALRTLSMKLTVVLVSMSQNLSLRTFPKSECERLSMNGCSRV